jgi:DNA-3-methyladenine glycosylase I
LKIRATIQKATSFLKIQSQFGSFAQFIWQFTTGETIINEIKIMSEIPCKSVESEAMSKALLKQGFKFVGPTICYSFMQAIGMVNDHIITCHRHKLC